MKYAAALVFFTFVTIAVFGFAGFNIDATGAFMNCAGKLTGVCSTANEMGVVHTKIYQSFSLAVAINFLLLLLTTICFSIITSARSLSVNFLAVSYDSNNSFTPKTRHWFSLLEKRDPLS